jgi:hypothetical protein
MPNNMTVARLVNTPRELNQGGTGTAEILFTTDGTVAAKTQLPSNGEFKNRPFLVRAWGRVTGGGTTNFTVKLYFGTSNTIASNTIVEASTARAVDSANHNWIIEIWVVWDEVSDKIQGVGRSVVANLADAVAVIDNVPGSVDPSDNTERAFTVTGTFSSGFAGNVANLDGLEVVGQ